MITIEYSGITFMPAYNTHLYVVDSNNNTQQSFRYIFDIFSSDFSDYHGRWDCPPRPSPNDGFGLFNPIVLNPLIDQSKDVKPEYVSWFRSPNSFCDFKIVSGERSMIWSFADNFFYTGSYVGFTGTTTHNFEVGDNIELVQDAGALNPSYNGFSRIIAIPDPYSIVINKPYGSSGPSDPGYVRHKNGDHIISSGLTTGSTAYLFGASMDIDEIASYDESEWMRGSYTGSAYPLTNMPSNYKMPLTARAFLSTPNFNADLLGAEFRSYTASGNLIDTAWAGAATSASTYAGMVYLPFGPYDAASYGLALSGASYYTVQVSGQTYGDDVDLITVGLDAACSDGRVNLLFMDGKGTWSTATFAGRNTTTLSVKKKTYMYDGIGTYAHATGFVTRTDSRGFDVHDSRTLVQMTLQTGELSLTDGNYLVEIIRSPFVYLQVSPTVWHPVIVDDTDIPLPEYDANEPIQYQIQISYAWDKNINI